MAGQKVILVGVDGSAEANMALDWAAARAKEDGSLVHVVCTYALASYSAAALDGGYAALDDDALQQGAQKAVDHGLERLRSHGLTEVTGTTEPGDATSVLVQLSEEVDLIVVGSRGRHSRQASWHRLLGTSCPCEMPRSCGSASHVRFSLLAD